MTIIDKIFDQIDQMMWDNKIKEIDDILNNLDINQLSLDELLAYLTITLPVKSKLRNRVEYYNKVKNKFIERNGVDRVKRVMERLL